MPAAPSKCPICGETALARAANEAFPFCSARCKLVDLSRWLGGDYRVAGDAVNADLAARDEEP